MNARQYQQKIVGLAKANKVKLDKYGLSAEILYRIGCLARCDAQMDILGIELQVRKFLVRILLWCEAHDTYLSFDEADHWIHQNQDNVGVREIFGHMALEAGRMMIKIAEEEDQDDAVPVDDNPWRTTGQRIFNSFALYAKLKVRDYAIMLEKINASDFITRQKT